MGRMRKHHSNASSTAGTPIKHTQPMDIDKVKKKKKRRTTIGSYTLPFLNYAFDVISKILSLLKWPLALLLTITLSRFLLYRSLSKITSIVSSQVRVSVCAVPYAGLVLDNIAPGFCNHSSAIDFESLIDLQKDTITVPAFTGSAPLRLKKAEMATNDLRIVLQGSTLSCKDTLDTALSTFSTHSRDASRAIQKTVVKVGGVLDTSLALNEWALNELNRHDTPSSFFNVFSRRATTTETYITAMNALAASLARLIESNQQAYASLDALEEDLHNIHTIVTQEKQFQKGIQEQDILTSLWSLLGGNKRMKAIFKTNLSTLSDFEQTRKTTKEVVAQTAVAYHKMMLQIEHLREEVSRPGLRDEVPVEVHVRTIQLGIESLRSRKNDGLLDD